MFSYYKDKYDYVEDDLIVFSLATLIKYFNANDYVELEDKICDYLEENKDRLEKYDAPKKYLYPINFADTKYIESRNIEVSEDVDLTLIMLLKTFKSFYIPNRELKFNTKNLVDVLMFKKEDFNG